MNDADPFHFPRPALEFALIQAECEMAVKRAMERVAIPAGQQLALLSAVSRELEVSPLNPNVPEARSRLALAWAASVAI